MPKKLLKTTTWLLLAVVTLTWCACWGPTIEVEQPQVAEKYSSFEATVWVTGHVIYENGEANEMISKIGVELPQELLTQNFPGNNRDENWLYFGIKLPQGWEVTDSIPFVGVDTGIFVYSDSLSAEMDTIEPPEPGYYWWVSETPEPIDTSYGTIEYFPEISTDGQTGIFFIDYMLGYNSGLNAVRNNDHYMGIGLPDTVWVTSSAESGPGSIRAAIDSVRPGGHICFALSLPVTIHLTEQIVINKDVNIHGPENMQVSISGSNVCRVIYINNYIEANLSKLCIINGNAEADYGGGIYCGQGASVSFNNLKIQYNQAASGGGIYFSNNEAYLENVSIRLNMANVDGGGIYCSGSSPLITNTVISGNMAYKGGGIYFQYSSPELTNLTVSGNTATIGGAVQAVLASSMEFTNCIFRGNNEYGIYLDDCGLVVSYSDIDGGLDGITITNNSWVDWLDGNIDEDPLFSSTGEHPFSLTGGSPCIDAGTPDTTGLNLPEWDFIGNMRVWDGVIDMGAYEYGAIPVGIDRVQVAGGGLEVLVYPNPVVRMMNIEYRILNVEVVGLRVFDIHGEEIARLVNETQASGEYTVKFDVSDLPAGIYLVRLQAAQQVATGKILVVH